MTLDEIRDLIVEADPAAKQYESHQQDTEAYTVWQQLYMLNRHADDSRIEAWAFFVHHYTPLRQAGNDPIPDRIREVLEQDKRVSYRCIVDYDTDKHLIHHIYDCEG